MCHRERSDIMPSLEMCRAGSTGGEQVELPNPLAILPPLTSAAARPVIFSWNSRTDVPRLWNLCSFHGARSVHMCVFMFVAHFRRVLHFKRVGPSSPASRWIGIVDANCYPPIFVHANVGRMTAEWPRGKVQNLVVSFQQSIG